MSTLTVAPAAARENRVLADRLGGTIAREFALVAAGTIAMIVLARISIPLPFTPVPVSLGTLGALSVGTTLGARRGLVSVAAYALLGIAGAPVFTGTNVGWAFASFGYILGYFLVAAIAGLAAQRGADRRVLTMAPTALASIFSVYVLGLAWMIPFAHMTIEQGIMKGFVPFIVGDLVKAAVAAGLFPVLRSILR
ncbi:MULTISPECIES: biotin transporter BioY [Actinomycetaceae]|uniref:biotin transporter BioY n=1 Tax=Actinomycetaceae TaxID=2049 RepID=UPI000395E873|nr:MULTISPECIES: biotin transporter BioY [Actinomycetaceae]ERH27500.1 BioY family protein [Actinomyces sp. oral taxon 172 str. F0311]WLD78493.1 biotin transporter BioY [Schaalia sp. HMT-172]